MDLVRRDGAAAPEFVALDIRGEAESLEASSDLVGAEKMIECALAGKALERERSGDTNSSSAGGAYEKQTVPMHVDSSPMEQFHPSTPTAGGAKRRRASRRVPGWRDPRKILCAFAALSSVGTLILLYFTLSMGKTTGGQADGQ